MIAGAATLEYNPPLAINIPAAERQNPLAQTGLFVPPIASPVTSEYGEYALHFSKLRALARDSTLWISAAEPPSANALAWAHYFLRHLRERAILPTRIVASAEGGTAICFVDGNRYADIESLNSGAILAVLSDRRNPAIVWEIEQSPRSITRAVDRICEFVQSP